MILRSEADDPKWLPAVEDGLVAFLKVLGVTSPIIIGLVLLAFSVKSWIDAFLSGKRLAGRARVAADATRQHLYGIGPLRIALASSVTAAVIAAQLVTLALMLLAGTLASALEELSNLGPGWETSGSRAAQNYLAFQAVWTEDGVNGLLSSRFYATLAFDGFVVAILVVGTIGLLGSYYSAYTGDGSWVGWGFAMALPLSIWLCVYTPFLLIGVAFQKFAEAGLTEDQKQNLTVSLISALYCLVCIVSAKGSEFVFAAWARPRQVSIHG